MVGPEIHGHQEKWHLVHVVHDFKRRKWPVSIALPGAGAFQIKITFSKSSSLSML